MALENLQHERLAHELTVSPSATEAYKKVYGVKSDEVASANASRVLAQNPSLRERVSEILNARGLSLDFISQRLHGHVMSENEGIALKAVEDAFKLHGAFSDDDKAVQIDTVNIVFGDVVAPPPIVSPNTSPAIELPNNG